MQPIPLDSPSPAKLRRRGLFRAILLAPMMLVLSATAVIWGLEGRSAGQTWIYPKGGTRYLATPDIHPLAFWIHTTGFVIVGVFFGVLSILVLWKALLGRGETRRAMLLRLGSHSTTGASPKISGWGAWFFVLGLIAVFVFIALKAGERL